MRLYVSYLELPSHSRREVLSVQRDDDSSTRLTGQIARPPDLQDGEDCLVVIFAGSQADIGQRHVLKSPLTRIGRSRQNDIVLASDSVSRHHAEITREGEEIIVRDLGSTNGTFINNDVERTRECRLRRGDQIRIGETILKFLSGTDIESQYHAIVASMALTDGLTAMANRKHLDTMIQEEMSRSRRNNRALSILMIDIDHFKQINDAHGHIAGDNVLKHIGALLLQRLRPGDKLGRYGGEEFCAILPETGRAEAAYVAESLRSQVAAEQFIEDGTQIPVTVSIGVAALRTEKLFTDLYRAADRRLYLAKQWGRNRVCFED
jgi:diguanylate cyclase (GGDEF)-like protein